MNTGSLNGLPNLAPSEKYIPLRGHFPDGIKTSGQQAPYYDELRSYEEFPEEIIGPTVWKAEEYQNRPERWTHQLTKEEVQEVSEAAENFKAAELPLLNISKVYRKTKPCLDVK